MDNDTRMTRRDWNSMPHNMIWSILDQDEEKGYFATHYDDPQQSLEDFSMIHLDLSAPTGLPDGVHTVRINYPCQAQLHGVEVINGKFVPGPTQRTIYEAICLGYEIDPVPPDQPTNNIDHVFIENITWNTRDMVLEVNLGS